MNLSEAVGQLFLIGIPGKSLDSETIRLLEFVRPGFVILFARNVENPAQVKGLLDDINKLLPYKPVFAIDQEGGIVSRLRSGFPSSPSTMPLFFDDSVPLAVRSGHRRRSGGVGQGLRTAEDTLEAGARDIARLRPTGKRRRDLHLRQWENAVRRSCPANTPPVWGEDGSHL